LKQKCRSGRIEARPKSERVEREFEGKLLPFFVFLFFFLLEKKKMPGINV
jgi:hypothetical protein